MKRIALFVLCVLVLWLIWGGIVYAVPTPFYLHIEPGAAWIIDCEEPGKLPQATTGQDGSITVLCFPADTGGDNAYLPIIETCDGELTDPKICTVPDD